MERNTLSKGQMLRAVFALASGTALIFLDSTILPVALPTIQKALNTNLFALEWVVNIYILVAAAFMIAGGRVADAYGHRALFCWGLGIFAFASALGAVALDVGMLVLSRALQGVGCAIISPTSFALIVDTFPEKVRGRMLGLLIGIASVFLSLGPIIGGFLTQYSSWRMIFWIQVPVALVGIWLVFASIPRSKRGKRLFDPLAFLLLVSSVSALVFAFMQGRTWGWTAPIILCLLGYGLLALLLLYVWEKKTRRPFIDFSLFKIRNFWVANTIVFLMSFVLMLTVFWPVYFQQTLEFTPLTAGLISGSATITLLFFAPFGGFLSDRFGPRLPITIGFGLVFFGTAWFLTVSDSATILHLVPALLTYGGGVSMVMAPTGVTTASAVDTETRGRAMGVYMTVRYLGSTMGIALLGSIIETVRQGNLSLGEKLSNVKGYHVAEIVALTLIFLGFCLAFVLRKRKMTS